MATLKQLKTFIAVAETLKMSEAAKRLYLSQPTVSQIIADLEKEYETTFFKRYPKRLELTPMGKLFWDRALNVLNSYETLNQSMKNSAVLRPLRVGELQLIYSIDHPFSGRDVIRAEDLYNCEFILREVGSGTRSIFENLMQTRHIPYSVKWESYSGSAILDGVARNLGIGVISTRYVKGSSRSEVIHARPIKDMPMNRYFYLCYNECHAFNSQMADFKDAAKSMK